RIGKPCGRRRSGAGESRKRRLQMGFFHAGEIVLEPRAVHRRRCPPASSRRVAVPLRRRTIGLPEGPVLVQAEGIAASGKAAGATIVPHRGGPESARGGPGFFAFGKPASLARS